LQQNFGCRFFLQFFNEWAFTYPTPQISERITGCLILSTMDKFGGSLATEQKARVCGQARIL
jgi:hypothetical protein